jgi:hypothetical protein
VLAASTRIVTVWDDDEVDKDVILSHVDSAQQRRNGSWCVAFDGDELYSAAAGFKKAKTLLSPRAQRNSANQNSLFQPTGTASSTNSTQVLRAAAP